jgi:hypothetical protein
MSQGRQGIMNTGDFAVTQNGTPNMSVNVAAGFGLVAGTQNTPVQGLYNLYNDATVNLAIAASNPTNPRIDVVVATVDDAYYGSGDNTTYLQVITGTPAASPSVPAIPANSLALAHVYVGAGVTSITNSNINTTSGTGNPDTIAFTPMRCSSYQNSATITASLTGLGALAPAAGLGFALNAGANRRYRFTFSGTVYCAAAAYVNVFLYRDGAQIAGVYPSTANASYQNANAIFRDTAPAAGMHQYQMYLAFSTGTTNQLIATAVLPASLVCEDIGPA